MRQLSSTDQQLIASGGIIVAAVVFGGLIAPLLVRQVQQVVSQRYLGASVADVTERIDERFPLTTPVRLLLRTLQLSVWSVALLALLTVWEQTGILLTVASYLTVTPGEVIRTVFTIALAVAAYVGMGLVEDIVESFGRETDRLTAHQEQIITRVSQIGLLVVAAVVGMSIWSINPGGLLVGAGFLGIVVGLAARQTLGSLIAGFVLMFARPFEIGDWVVVGDDIEGVVTDITIVNTRLENFDGEFVVIPNDKVAEQPITNRSRKGRLRLRVDVGVDYATDPDHAVTVATEAIETVERVEETPSPHVFPRSFGDSAVILEMRFWIDHPNPPKRWRAQAAVIREVKTAFEREGIKIPYPQRELSGRAETGGFQVRDTGERPSTEREAYPDGEGTDDSR